ncbi:hypothetical protein [Halodurantibacterium flavum]|uniref:Uncharacterized protein n=1 Tax=Halodurantibacterium flavum TaxID=1382802 RepID=A0ABW4S6C3_9RHOB
MMMTSLRALALAVFVQGAMPAVLFAQQGDGAEPPATALPQATGADATTADDAAGDAQDDATQGAAQGETDQPTEGQSTEELDLDSLAIENSQAPEPDEQGLRDPMATPGAGNEDSLYSILSAVRMAPPGLDGRPMPRPNALASEPALEMPPEQPEDLYLFPDGYIE